MDPLRYRQLKIYQLLHDPPGKPFHLKKRGKGVEQYWLKHADLAQKLFRSFTGSKLKGWARADLAASGADRPVTAAGRTGTRGAWVPPVIYNDADNRLILHPLAPEAALLVPHPDDTFVAPNEEIVPPEDVHDDDQLQQRAIEALRDAAGPDWKDPGKLERAAFVVWRRLRDELMTLAVEESGQATRAESFRFGDPLWEHMPAETRAPDHSIWDHTRVAAALSFLDVAADTTSKKHPIPPEQEPWMLCVSLGPVGEFIRQSRKAQDLWLSSFLLADLAFHAMKPIVEQYGPENIVYPDLRGNPRADHWLKGEHPEALPLFVEDPSTCSALVPNTFTAIVPRGGAGHLRKLEDVARDCAGAVQERWRSLSELVLGWFVEQATTKGRLDPRQRAELERAWREQHEAVIHVRWTAVAWKTPEPLSRPLPRVDALPGQDPAELPAAPPADVQAGAARAARLRPWVPKDAWDHYEKARDVFARVDLRVLQGERGFDYALTHHQLRARHAIRKQTATVAAIGEQQGEKCTMCGQRTALGDGGAPDGKRAAIESRRQRARDFWKQGWLDPEQTGAERLCAVCTFKRFLVEADGDRGNQAINASWAGREVEVDDLRKAGGGQVRVPFPSTSAIASQRFLAAAAKHPDLTQPIAEVVRAHKNAGLRETQFPDALPLLAEAHEAAAANPSTQQFLQRDPEETIFPRSLDGEVARLHAEDPARVAPLTELQQAIQGLLRAADERGLGKPATRFAVIEIDGDAMGKLLLGDAERIATTWRDVIHPKHLDAMTKNAEIQKAGWTALLDEKRLMGPSLHAFVSRALAEFTHRIVPWVVEQEHAGRLVYAGGDDVLALAPAEDAVKIAWRLQQLFSATWVIDTQYDVDTWGWRRPGAKVSFKPEKARDRFRVLELARSGRTDLDGAAKGPLLAMLGPGASLSAGITIGHYKTPLRAMLREAHRLLDEVAKDETGRAAVALSYCTRGGPKYQLGMKWTAGGVLAAEAIDRVARAFRDRALPSRLPYKLREAARAILGALEAAPAREAELLSGLLRRELDGRKIDSDLHGAVLALWREGLRTSLTPRRDGEERRDHHGAGKRMADGLLLARALGTGEQEADE